jgi:4-hydroxy-4-methyl-2-oxoglutarate aldolase
VSQADAAIQAPRAGRSIADVTELHLHTAAVGDVLDAMGRTHQFLPAEIHSISAGRIVVGRAMPVLIADVCGPQQQPFGRLTEALDQLRSGEVYVARGGRVPCAAWGEILSAAAASRGAAGAVIDGYHRDTRRVIAQGFPVFSRGAYAQDAAVRSRVTDFRVPIEIGGVSIAPGDLIFGDEDGVVVIPQGIENEVVERALAKMTTESAVLADVQRGASSTAVLRDYGVL